MRHFYPSRVHCSQQERRQSESDSRRAPESHPHHVARGSPATEVAPDQIPRSGQPDIQGSDTQPLV